ncbi:hypothetical protein GXW71_17225 [Roseomonas hellenica]|uniref:Uncharacterized protein n=1 Tax=Plastoroseomonas hellenica TaxID=2687306 RepID=A0ABS5F1V6_9PROT|nr:hypothetical protein [Plastoroseomonas hellenica]MBR0666105.1 hypothetical protein [Plastoroseomonas hellenica]
MEKEDDFLSEAETRIHAGIACEELQLWAWRWRNADDAGGRDVLTALRRRLADLASGNACKRAAYLALREGLGDGADS